MDRAFTNEDGKLDYSDSIVILYNDILIASIMLVEDAPWEDTPPGPFIIQLMVHPDHRKLGLAEFLIQNAAAKLDSKGAQTVALRVMSGNRRARNLYSKCGFISWIEQTENPDK